MNVDELLLSVATAAAQRSQLCPGLGSDQARHAAQQLLSALQITTAGPARPRELPPARPTAQRPRPRWVDSPTQALPIVRPPQRFAAGAAPAYRGPS